MNNTPTKDCCVLDTLGQDPSKIDQILKLDTQNYLINEITN